MSKAGSKRWILYRVWGVKHADASIIPILWMPVMLAKKHGLPDEARGKAVETKTCTPWHPHAKPYFRILIGHWAKA